MTLFRCREATERDRFSPGEKTPIPVNTALKLFGPLKKLLKIDRIPFEPFKKLLQIGYIRSRSFPGFRISGDRLVKQGPIWRGYFSKRLKRNKVLEQTEPECLQVAWKTSQRLVKLVLRTVNRFPGVPMAFWIAN